MILPAFLILAAAVQAPVAVPSGPGPQARRPAQTYFSPDDYPAAARGSGAHGIVRFMLTTDATGRVVACTITQSSGSPVLDRATCDIMRRRARFSPVAGNIEQQMVWQLER